MIKNLLGAIAEEQRYLNDKKNNLDSSLLQRLSQFGYTSLSEYFTEKKNYLFSQWKPKVIYDNILNAPQLLENAIQNKEYGIYILRSPNLYAFYGKNGIDLDLCKTLNIIPANMGYNGGIIIGSDEDLALEIVIPAEINLNGHEILTKIANILSQYMSNVTIDGNDILVNNKKVAGSMERHFPSVYVWAIQISFADYTYYISQLCNKQSQKEPSYIDKTKCTKQQLEFEVLKWLQKS